MTIKCHTIIDPLGRVASTSPWLSIGSIYTVLTLHVSEAGKILVRVLADNDAGPALFPLKMFEVIDGAIPRDWIITYNSDAIAIGPQAWSQPGFWEKYFNGDREAIDTVKQRIASD